MALQVARQQGAQLQPFDGCIGRGSEHGSALAPGAFPPHFEVAVACVVDPRVIHPQRATGMGMAERAQQQDHGASAVAQGRARWQAGHQSAVQTA